MFEHIQHSEHARDIIAKIILISWYVRSKCWKLRGNVVLLPPPPHYSLSDFNPQASIQPNVAYKKPRNLLWPVETVLP